MKITVYHYTSKESLRSIIQTKIFDPSYLSPELDTAYGKGHYFTDLPPNTNDKIISKRLWNIDDTNKIESYLAFEIDKSLLEDCRQNVYRLPIGVIQEHYINIGLRYTSQQNSNITMIKYLTHGLRETKDGNNVWKTIGNITLIGIGILLLSKLIN
ncbi:MAG: hypothetical protein K8R54_06820 [Bacteroidales bacterium]|nr:hypothetical protein [Bacteroidales bacterium]